MVVGVGPRGRAGAPPPTPGASGRSADPIGFRFWRSGRIVPPRTPPHRRRNRGIMRKSPSASGVLARTILPERHIPPRAGSAGAFSASSGRATPVEAPAAAMLRARTRSARPAAPAAEVRGVDGARRQGGKRWPAHNFRVRRRRCASGERRHCATSWREGCGAEGERYAPATFLSRWTASPPTRPRPRWGECSRKPPPWAPWRPARARGGVNGADGGGCGNGPAEDDEPGM